MIQYCPSQCFVYSTASANETKVIAIADPTIRLSRKERLITAMSVEDLIREYNLIKIKRSLLSANLRDVVKLRVQFLIDKGDIKNVDSND